MWEMTSMNESLSSGSVQSWAGQSGTFGDGGWTMRTRRGGVREVFPSGLSDTGPVVGVGVVVVEVSDARLFGWAGDPATSSGPCDAAPRFVPGGIVESESMAEERDGAEQSSRVGGTDCSATIQ